MYATGEKTNLSRKMPWAITGFLVLQNQRTRHSLCCPYPTIRYSLRQDKSFLLHYIFEFSVYPNHMKSNLSISSWCRMLTTYVVLMYGSFTHWYFPPSRDAALYFKQLSPIAGWKQKKFTAELAEQSRAWDAAAARAPYAEPKPSGDLHFHATFVTTTGGRSFAPMGKSRKNSRNNCFMLTVLKCIVFTSLIDLHSRIDLAHKWVCRIEANSARQNPEC